MPRWLVRSMLALVACATMLGAASCWLFTEPARELATRREAALALWQRTRAPHYQLRARLLSMAGGETVLLEVQGDRLIAGWRGNGSKALAPAELAELETYFPVEQLFTLAQREEGQTDWRGALVRALPQLGAWLGVPCQPRTPPAPRYDAQRGFPSRLFVGVSRCALNSDGIEVRVDEVRVLP